MKRKTLTISIRKIFCFILAIFIIYYGGMKIWAATVETTSVTFADNNLYQSLRTRLSKYIISRNDETKTLEIRTDGMPEITELDLSNCQISDLSGIESFTSLITLNLSKNTITDVSDLSSLTNLKTLNLSNNTISNISNIRSLTTLADLNLNSNKISDISAVASLGSLQTLDVSNNAISTAVAVKSLSNLTSLNISQNSSLANISDVLMEQLTVLNISSTAITNVEGITTCRNLIELNISNNNISSLTPLFETEKVGNETVAILRNIQKLDVGYTTKSGLTFSNLKKITALRELYAQGNALTSVSGIAEMGSLEYVNLDDNDISNIDYFRTTTTQNGMEVTKYLIPATQISLANNEIEDISVLSYLEDIEYLNLAGNHIQVISPIEKFDFTKGVDLRNQTITMPIYQKKNNENHYVILFNIMQSAKDEGSIAYAENANFTTEGVTLNTNPTYTVAPYYNVIITPDKTDDDLLSVTLHGGIADGTKITFEMSTSSAIETLQFEDPNLDAAIYKYLLTHMSESSYIARAPKIINITQREIANTKELDISSASIKNLKGLSNFSKLKILNLSNNEISDDSEIKYLEDLQVLNFANNKLDNQYTSIETLYDLTNLDLSGNNIQDLNSLNNYLVNLEAERDDPQLTELTLANNNLTNVEVLYNLSTLQGLNISNNDITDISYISPNKALNTLNISGNNIEDISIISNLRNIKTLIMSNCNLIHDIRPISNLSLTTLDISGNRITDITPLQNQTGLTNLYINNNNIADVSSIEGLLLRGTFEAKQQKLTQVLDESASGTITVELPEIFKSSKDSSSKVYTTNEFSLENCQLSSDGNSIEINTDDLGDNEIARATIVGGQADRTTFSVADALKGTITYSPETKTKENVVATISFNRDGVRILNNDGKNTYTFTKNDEFTFIYQDDYGFSGEAKATVNWIDNEGPKANISYSIEEITNQDVEVTITADEAIRNQIDGWEFTDGTNKEMKKSYSQNTEETINIEDELGNSSEVKISIKNIDKTQPKISGVENGKTYEEAVTPNVTDENLEKITLIKDGSPVSNYTNGQEITANGKYTLTATDSAGNETTVEFTIEREEIDDTITSSEYEVDMENLKISRISPETQLSSFKNSVTTEVGYKIENLAGQEIKNTDRIGTGYTLITDTGKEYTLVVTGDLDGDGQIKLADLAQARKHYLRVEILQGVYEEAADLDGNGNVALIDISNMRKVILGMQDI